MWSEYICVSQLDEALAHLAEGGERARIIAGATDLLLELERGARKGIETLIDITRVPGQDQISLDQNGVIHLGPLVTHNQVVASALLRQRAFLLVQACWEVGAPQIRNRGTLAGNLITASPANDTIAPLMALGASVVLRSTRRERVIALADFYTGVRRTVMQPDEVLVDIRFPALLANQRGTFVKIGLRRAQAISLVNTAILLTLDGEQRIQQAVLTLGAVAPTIVRAVDAEAFLLGRILDEDGISQAAELAQKAARPIGDIRSSAVYRDEMVRVAVSRGLRALRDGQASSAVPDRPPLLWGQETLPKPSPLLGARRYPQESVIVTHINGQKYVLPNHHHKTLLRLLREDAGLIGTKEGCAEGECGACTVFLDGMAVMSCLVPAARAHGAKIHTVEGLAAGGQLHPVQQAFMDEGAVQCGYCTPGFVMSAVKLLEENPTPTRDEIRQAIAGNLCRCTGYYSIVAAVERSATTQQAALLRPAQEVLNG